MIKSHTFAFDNSYAKLPDRFFAFRPPTPVIAPELIHLNDELAQELGLDASSLRTPKGLAFLSGNKIPDGAEPLAMAYAGHQFGRWVPQLGDGRAVLLGETVNPAGIRHDIVLKGAGRTPFSRNGDGRAALGPVLREYILSEAMAKLGIPTTRALAAVTTGEMVMRDGPMPGAILTRIAQSHVRVGTFQFFAGRKDKDGLCILADYVIDRHYPDVRNDENPYLGLLKAVISAQAKLIAQWQSIGFIHGVMNTDNMSIAGETIDYGPCAFMDTYHPITVYSSIDHEGRYAYGNQPNMAHWNLSCLAQALLPLIHEDADQASDLAIEALNSFPDQFDDASMAIFRKKLGLLESQESDKGLVSDLFSRMKTNKVDFTLAFRSITHLSAQKTKADEDVQKLFKDPADFDAWVLTWRKRLLDEHLSNDARQDMMKRTNPAVIPRNHLVEEALNGAIYQEDFSLFEKLHMVLSAPFDDQEANSPYILPPRKDQIVQATFCGT
jgi:serine/tyrosine/threonine adenylyltransferase